jgi:hypothetical protein
MDYAAECVERSLPAIEAEARADLLDRLAAGVQDEKPAMSMHTCWDAHEGQHTLHADGSECDDRPTYLLDRAAVLALIKEARNA